MYISNIEDWVKEVGMKIQKKEFAFYLSYIMLYVSLFIGDVYSINELDAVAKLLRLGSYALIAVSSINLKLKRNDFFCLVVIFITTLFYGLKTGDLYWSILILFIYNTKKINTENIYKISYKTIVIGIIIVLGCCALGLLPDVLTSRDTVKSISFDRHSFGFYHSNVIPLLIFYLEVYYICIAKEKVKDLAIVLYMFSAFIASFFCNSRNALFCSVILSIFVLFEKRKSQRTHRFLYKVAILEVPCLSLFSFAMMFLLLKGGIWNSIDTAFSGRFRLAIFKMRRIGLHLINIMSNNDFLNDNLVYVNGKKLDTIVLDNGYLYVMLRYGFLILVFYFIVAFLLADKNKRNGCVLYAVITVFIINFVDNDLVDYSFLPFILWAFNAWKANPIVKNVEEKFSRKHLGSI